MTKYNKVKNEYKKQIEFSMKVIAYIIGHIFPGNDMSTTFLQHVYNISTTFLQQILSGRLLLVIIVGTKR